MSPRRLFTLIALATLPLAATTGTAYAGTTTTEPPPASSSTPTSSAVDTVLSDASSDAKVDSSSASVVASATDNPTFDQYKPTDGGGCDAPSIGSADCPLQPPATNPVDLPKTAVLGGGDNPMPLKTAPTRTVEGGGLPFTGAQLQWVFGFGLLLMGLGAAIHLRGRRNTNR